MTCTNDQLLVIVFSYDTGKAEHCRYYLRVRHTYPCYFLLNADILDRSLFRQDTEAEAASVK